MAGVRRGYVPWLKEKKVAKALGLRQELFGLRTAYAVSATVSARALLSAVSYQNFLRWVVPGGFRLPGSGWNARNETGVMELGRNGRGRAEAVASDGLRNDMPWRRKMLSARPTKGLLRGVIGGCVWYPRPPQLRERALGAVRGAVCTIFTNASGARRWSASFGEVFIQGVCPKPRCVKASIRRSCGRCGHPWRSGGPRCPVSWR